MFKQCSKHRVQAMLSILLQADARDERNGTNEETTHLSSYLTLGNAHRGAAR